ncbi:MAG: hypothetical protein JKX98_12075, partial [Alcanivoracaceae bacterium]|nr:hypothetical protein [Alcanivoracaceae bacterium]
MGNFEICRVTLGQNSAAKFNVFMHTKNSGKISKVMKSLNSKHDLSIIQGDELTLPTVMMLKEKVDAGEFVVIAGPCAVESQEQINDISMEIKATGGALLRGGI